MLLTLFTTQEGDITIGIMPFELSEQVSSFPGSFTAPSDDVFSDSSFIVPDLYAWSAQYNPYYPLFLYVDNGQHRYITYSTANEAINRAARYALSCTGQVRKPSPHRPVVAILANTGINLSQYGLESKITDRL